MEATIFTGWIYDLKPHAAAGKVARPLMLRLIAASKKKNDRIEVPCSVFPCPSQVDSPRPFEFNSRTGPCTTVL
jgi:hypothetical protein